ncbi:hypothetical protein ATKI12_8781 [Kitasatospora sp. Ki12]
MSNQLDGHQPLRHRPRQAVWSGGRPGGKITGTQRTTAGGPDAHVLLVAAGLGGERRVQTLDRQQSLAVRLIDRGIGVGERLGQRAPPGLTAGLIITHE